MVTPRPPGTTSPYPACETKTIDIEMARKPSNDGIVPPSNVFPIFEQKPLACLNGRIRDPDLHPSWVDKLCDLADVGNDHGRPQLASTRGWRAPIPCCCPRTDCWSERLRCQRSIACPTGNPDMTMPGGDGHCLTGSPIFRDLSAAREGR